MVKLEDEKLVVKAVQQKIQGQWTNWQNIMRRDMSWNSLLRGSRRMVAFGLGVTFDALATPNNLKRWGYLVEGSCVLCGGKSCGIAHILSGCNVSLAGGRYRDRHNAVIKLTPRRESSESPLAQRNSEDTDQIHSDYGRSF